MKRERQRYIVFDLICDDPSISSDDLKITLWKHHGCLFGEYGTSKAGLWLIHFDPTLKRGVIRCSLSTLNQVRASLASLCYVRKKNSNKDSKIPVIFHVIGVSGTILSVKRKYFHVPSIKNKSKNKNKQQK